MGRFKGLMKSPEFQRWLKEERPVIQKRLRDTKTLNARMQQKRINEALTSISNAPEAEQPQVILTPVQQIELRDAVAKCRTIDQAVKLINKTIFEFPPEQASEIDTAPTLNDEEFRSLLSHFDDEFSIR